MNLFKNKFYEGENVPKSTYLTFSLITGFKDAIFQFISLFLLLYVEFGTSLSEESNFSELFSICTFGIIGVKLIAPIFFTIVPYLMNKIKFKSGSFRPWIFIGTTLSMIFFIFIFFIPFKGIYYVITFLIAYFLFEISYCFEDTAYWAFLPTMTNDEKKRSKISSIACVTSCMGSYTLSAILPAVTGGKAGETIRIIAIIAAVLFLITQYVLCIVMKEKVNTNKKQIKPHLFDMFTVFVKNKYMVIGVICYALMFVAQFLIVGNSVNYFYYNYGYGTQTIYGSLLPAGGIGGVSFIYTVIYGVAYILGFGTYPLLIKKFTRKQILTAATIMTIVGHICLFTFLFNRNMLIPLFICEFFIFYFQCLLSGVFTMAASLPIEYNELKFGERREVEFLTIRSTIVKYGSALQTGLFYAFLIFSGLMTLNTNIGQLEVQGAIDPTFDVVGNVNNLITSTISSDIYDYHLVIYRIGMVLIPMLLTFIAWFLYIKFYKLDETAYKNVVAELNKK